VVAVKPSAPAVAPAESTREAEPTPAVVAKATQITVVTTETDSSGEWERTVQMRMMELDVDPGNDASGLTKRAGK
jgi:hypothetical protein